MKIYFAGSIRGGRDRQAIYLEIVSYLRKYGEVLTEHVADAKTTSSGEKISEKTIFERDIKWLGEADVVVAEVTNPSLGVGYELGRAEKMGKRILCLYYPSPEKKLSAMVRGNSAVQVVDYETIDDVKKAIDNFFKTV